MENLDITPLEFEDMFQQALRKSGVSDDVIKLCKQHDDLMIFLTLKDIFYMIDLMELGDRQKLEFVKPTNKGQIQLEAAEKTYSRIRDKLLECMNDTAKEIEQIGRIKFERGNDGNKI